VSDTPSWDVQWSAIFLPERSFRHHIRRQQHGAGRDVDISLWVSTADLVSPPALLSMGFSLCGPIFGKRRSDIPAADVEDVEPPPRRGRETLRKRTPVPPSTRSREESSTVAKKEGASSAVELDNVGPVRSSMDVRSGSASPPRLEVTVDPPSDCAELSADPPVKPPAPPKQLDQQDLEKPSTELEELEESPVSTQEVAEVPPKHRRQSLPVCPPSLVPGSPPAVAADRIKTVPKRASTWSEDLHKDAPYAFMPRPYGFGSGWQSRPDLMEEALAVWQTPSPTSPSSIPSAARTPSDASLTTASSLSSESIPSPKETVDIRYPLSPQRQKFMSGVPLRTISAQPSLTSLSPRQSTANLGQLLARHALLESRRQILMQLHEVEQEQELILDELAASVPEEQFQA
jgi:hypothetical protein